MQQVTIQYLETAFGELVLGAYQHRLCLCDWRYRANRQGIDNRIKKGLKAEFIEGRDSMLSLARQQLAEYFSQQRQSFSIPLTMVGSEFQRKVWQGLLAIPFGSTLSYQQLASKVAGKNATRAVASANGANAMSIIVPCHRVVGSNGQMTGYAGGINTKRKLLDLESDLFARHAD